MYTDCLALEPRLIATSTIIPVQLPNAPATFAAPQKSQLETYLPRGQAGSTECDLRTRGRVGFL